MSPGAVTPAAAVPVPRGIDRTAPDSRERFAPSRGDSTDTIKPSSSSLARSISNPSSDRFSTIKQIGSSLKRKGKHHLKIGSDSSGAHLHHSQPLIASPPSSSHSGSSSSSSPPQHYPIQQHLLLDSFAQLAVSAPPPSPAALIASPTSSSSPPPPKTDPSASTGAPGRRRPSFRYENYPRRPIMQQLSPSASNIPLPPAMSSPGLGADTPPTPPPDDLDVRVPALLQNGTPMLKISAKKAKTLTFRLDADLGQIQWESRKTGIGEHFPLLARSCIHFNYLNLRSYVILTHIAGTD